MSSEALSTRYRAAARGQVGAGSRRAQAPWHNVDFLLMSVTGALALLGTLMISSVTHPRLVAAGGDPHTFLKKQLLFVMIGVVLMVAVASIDYRSYINSAPTIFGLTVLLLTAVLFVGNVHKGIRAWFDIGPLQLQPSEFAKLSLIVVLAAYCAAQRMELDGRRVLTVLVLAGVPIGLIYLEPDLGSAMVFLAIVLVMLAIGGVAGRHLLVLFAIGVVVTVVAVRWGFLDPYQLKRLTVFVDPSKDVQGQAYNLNAAKVAYGLGGLTGKGLFGGQLTRYAFVPEQRTDFIFTAVGEQLGFIGAATVLALFALACARIWRIAAGASDASGTLICSGVLGMFAFQIFENLGMTMGIMPITGIPLPFLSYGGSATLVSFAAIGLVLNVGMHRFR